MTNNQTTSIDKLPNRLTWDHKARASITAESKRAHHDTTQDLERFYLSLTYFTSCCLVGFMFTCTRSHMNTNSPLLLISITEPQNVQKTEGIQNIKASNVTRNAMKALQWSVCSLRQIFFPISLEMKQNLQ